MVPTTNRLHRSPPRSTNKTPSSRTFFILLLGLLTCLLWRTKAASSNSSDPSLKNKAVQDDALIQTVQQRQVFGNASDPIVISELPGYTGWPRNRIESKVDQCFVTDIGGRNVSLIDASLNILHLHISNSMSVMWNISIACPNSTVATAENKTHNHHHLPSPLFYARAYGPAILVGNPQTLSGIVHHGQPYSQKEISFAIMDPGLYTVEVVLESIVSPNFNTLHGWDAQSPPYYDGFMLLGFPLILNVTRSDIPCNNSTKTCRLNFCTGKDIESDQTSVSGRWIVLGHGSEVKELPPFVLEKHPKDDIYQKYVDGSHRLSLRTDYKPIHCVLATLTSSVAWMDTCAGNKGIHFVLLGDSVTGQHAHSLKHFLKAPNRMTLISLGFPTLTLVHETYNSLLRIKQENSSQSKVILFNTGLHEVLCLKYLDPSFRTRFNHSDVFNISTCMKFYRHNFKRLLDLIVQIFPSELKIFRTTNAAWVKWGNFGFAWPPDEYQNMVRSPHVVRKFNDIALEVIKESGYDVKVYDLFWMSWSRPDSTEIQSANRIGGHMVHLGQDTLKVSIRKLLTIVADHFGCLK